MVGVHRLVSQCDMYGAFGVSNTKHQLLRVDMMVEMVMVMGMLEVEMVLGASVMV